MVTDNCYATISLAVDLLKKQMHLMGTLRNDRKFNPIAVFEEKLCQLEQSMGVKMRKQALLCDVGTNVMLTGSQQNTLWKHN